MPIIILPIGEAKQVQGDTFEGFSFQRAEDGKETNLTGVSIEITFELSENPAKAKKFTIGNGISVINYKEGWAKMDRVLRLDWDKGLWVGKLSYIFPDGTKYTDWDLQMLVS